MISASNSLLESGHPALVAGRGVGRTWPFFVTNLLSVELSGVLRWSRMFVFVEKIQAVYVLVENVVEWCAKPFQIASY